MAPLLDPARQDDRHIDRRLTSERIIWLVTVSADGRPHAVPVWFCWADPLIWIFSMPSTHKLNRLRANPAVTLMLDTAAGGGDVVTVNGDAELLAPEEFDAAGIPAFAEKYAPVVGPDDWPDWVGRFRQPIRVEVTRILAWISTSTGPNVRVVTGRTV